MNINRGRLGRDGTGDRPGRARRRRSRATRGPRRGGPGGWLDRGMVTAELAVSILAAAFIAAGMCWVIGVIGTQVRCQDSASAIARQLARGDEAAADRARGSVPDGSDVQISDDDGVVRVAVTAELHWGRLGPVTVGGRATVTKEPHAVERQP